MGCGVSGMSAVNDVSKQKTVFVHVFIELIAIKIVAYLFALEFALAVLKRVRPKREQLVDFVQGFVLWRATVINVGQR